MRIDRRGFTLIEIGLSLVILAVAVTSMFLIFPTGIRAQHLARFRLYAAIKASEMVESFMSTQNVETNIDTEAFSPWDVPAGYKVLNHDLEDKIATHRAGIMPLPREITGRLDSDGDEIGTLYANGGNLYYAQANGTSGLEDQMVMRGELPSSQTQKLVFAVLGHAQQNAISFFPWKDWPYYAEYPSPPTHGLHHRDQFMPANAIQFSWPPQGWWVDRDYCYEGAGPAVDGVDPDIAKVFAWHETEGAAAGDYGFKPYAYDIGGSAPTMDAAIRYLQSALWYCAKKGLPANFYDPNVALDPSPSAPPSWIEVNAMRFLSHAATCLTKFKKYDELSIGLVIPAVKLDGFDAPAITLTHQKILLYHESCLNLAMCYAACCPYDWGAPRPMQRAQMMDNPLIQYDLFSPALSGTLFATSKPAQQWKPVAAQKPAHVGVSYSYPDRGVPDEIWGDQSHFTLADPFTYAERCREIVFWSVDWQSYEDFELLPSAPIDASKFNIAAPMNRMNGADNLGVPCDFSERMVTIKWSDPHLFAYRNPEKNIAFFADVTARATGDDIKDVLLTSYGDPNCGRDQVNGNPFALSSSNDADARRCFIGAWGADRNFNGKLDRGLLPRSVRMRATLIDRYLYYDPRVAATLR